ncbi:transglutaminase domain-containing protein [Flavobacterium sp.]|uniref:transglutaminase-like domain-containing protein n=1 Tax=Flavobacterium sp. TaxID=239 RepID=UPI0011FBFB11|nr:transglutaminase domain-containing protein [Flavobacterium sp.]RZJ68977.1 MAG: transglutaminase domain-containing protein [Flavobacterium sp.]
MKHFFTIGLVFVAAICFGQKKLKTIESGIANIDVRDGSKLRKGAWRISSEVSPDEFVTSNDRVTFFTDKDSITVKVNKQKPTDFIIKFDGKEALTRISYQPSFLDKLKSASKYDAKEQQDFPAYSFQSADDAYLVSIRNKFKLDSIAGEGSSTSRILNLMHWMHNTVRHDGSSKNPTSRNAQDLVAICKKENRGLNCRMMAIALNECYLALGIKSRYVTCMPKEEQFDDCHVINSVFDDESKRWIWIDPTFDAYVMDEKGQLLGLSEVRQRLINGKTLLLNPEANWNREETQTADYYLYTYMAKNLYRIETPVRSEANFETWRSGHKVEYVQLLPLDGSWKKKEKQTEFNTETKTEFTYFQTHNPDAFWGKQ